MLFQTVHAAEANVLLQTNARYSRNQAAELLATIAEEDDQHRPLRRMTDEKADEQPEDEDDERENDDDEEDDDDYYYYSEDDDNGDTAVDEDGNLDVMSSLLLKNINEASGGAGAESGDGFSRDVVVAEIAGLPRFRFEFLSMLFPSWQMAASRAHQHLNRRVVDLAVFVEPDSLPFLPASCKRFESADVLASKDATCFFIPIEGNYTREAFNGYRFQMDYAYMAGSDFARLVSPYESVLRVDVDSILAPGLLAMPRAADTIYVSGGFTGTNYTALILRSIRMSGVLGKSLGEDAPWVPSELLRKGIQGTQLGDEGDPHHGKGWGIFGLTQPEYCCRDFECDAAESEACASSVAAARMSAPVVAGDVIYHQDAVFMPGSLAASIGKRWADLSLELWNTGFSSHRCEEFGALLQENSSTVCDYPHWHDELSALYALNLVMGELTSGELAGPGMKARVSLRMDSDKFCSQIQDDVAMISMMEGKHQLLEDLWDNFDHPGQFELDSTWINAAMEDGSCYQEDTLAKWVELVMLPPLRKMWKDLAETKSLSHEDS